MSVVYLHTCILTRVYSERPVLALLFLYVPWISLAFWVVPNAWNVYFIEVYAHSYKKDAVYTAWHINFYVTSHAAVARKLVQVHLFYPSLHSCHPFSVASSARLAFTGCSTAITLVRSLVTCTKRHQLQFICFSGWLKKSNNRRWGLVVTHAQRWDGNGIPRTPTHILALLQLATVECRGELGGLITRNSVPSTVLYAACEINCNDLLILGSSEIHLLK